VLLTQSLGPKAADYRAAVLNLWAAALCLVGRDKGWEIAIFLCESRVTIHEKVPSVSSGVRASATYANIISEHIKKFQADIILSFSRDIRIYMRYEWIGERSKLSRKSA